MQDDDATIAGVLFGMPGFAPLHAARNGDTLTVRSRQLTRGGVVPIVGVWAV